MKGTELNEKQLKAAEEFVLAQRSATSQVVQTPAPTERVSIEWQQFVRMVAWYGALRAAAMLKGGSVENPSSFFAVEGEMVSVPPRKDH